MYLLVIMGLLQRDHKPLGWACFYIYQEQNHPPKILGLVNPYVLFALLNLQAPP